MDYSVLVSKVKHSDHNAFKALYEDLFNHINDFVFYKTKDRSLSMDITQEVFSRVWVNRSKLDIRKNIKSFLLKIAHNLVIDHYRKKSSSESRIESENIGEMETSVSTDKSDSIYKLLDQIPANHRDVFLLSKVEGLSYKEIAEIFDVSHKTVDSWMQKTFVFLRKHLLTILIILRKFL